MSAAGFYVQTLSEALDIRETECSQDDPEERFCEYCQGEMYMDSSDKYCCPECEREEGKRNWRMEKDCIDFHMDR